MATDAMPTGEAFIREVCRRPDAGINDGISVVDVTYPSTTHHHGGEWHIRYPPSMYGDWPVAAHTRYYAPRGLSDDDDREMYRRARKHAIMLNRQQTAYGELDCPADYDVAEGEAAP